MEQCDGRFYWQSFIKIETSDRLATERRVNRESFSSVFGSAVRTRTYNPSVNRGYFGILGVFQK
jgi:hypothetical protein